MIARSICACIALLPDQFVASVAVAALPLIDPTIVELNVFVPAMVWLPESFATAESCA